MKFELEEVGIDRETGLLKSIRGVSIDSNPAAVVKFGGAYRVQAIPADLTIVQRGKRSSHFEIVPRSPMTPERYQELLNDVELEAPSDESKQY